MGKCECKDCGGLEGLLNVLLESDELEDMFMFKQWLTADCAEIVTMTKVRDEFFQYLVEKVNDLIIMSKKSNLLHLKTLKFL